MRYIVWSFAVIGISFVGLATWQRYLPEESIFRSFTDTGSMVWLFPARIRNLGPNNPYVRPRLQALFAIDVEYPAEISNMQGFEIRLTTSFTKSELVSGSEDAEDRDSSLPSGLEHSFTLELPGMNFAPNGPNRAAVDDVIRWQVAPQSASGTYRGFIRPSGNDIELMGGEWGIEWKNPGDLQLTIEVQRSFKFLDKFESLLMGLIGSLFTVPALIKLYFLSRNKSVGG